MKAIIMHAYGNEDVVEYIEVERPEPKANDQAHPPPEAEARNERRL